MSKNKLLLLVLALVAAVVGGLIWNSSRVMQSSREEALKAQAAFSKEEAQGEGPRSPEEIAQAFNQGGSAMSMTQLEMVQGGKGEAQWRLSAQEARMADQGGVALATEPVLTYYPAPDPDGKAKDPIKVRSESGQVDQMRSLARFVESVVVEREGDVLTSELLEYDGRAKTLKSPGPAQIKGPAMNGGAGNMTLFLDEDRLEAEGGVEVDWMTAAKDSPLERLRPDAEESGDAGAALPGE